MLGPNLTGSSADFEEAWQTILFSSTRNTTSYTLPRLQSTEGSSGQLLHGGRDVMQDLWGGEGLRATLELGAFETKREALRLECP